MDLCFVNVLLRYLLNALLYILTTKFFSLRTAEDAIRAPDYIMLLYNAAADDGEKFPVYLYTGLFEYSTSIFRDSFEPMSC